MIVAAAIPSARELFDPVVLELAQEGRVPVVAKVLEQPPALLQVLGNDDAEGAAVGDPRDALGGVAAREHVVELLREGHLGEVGGGGVALLRWHTGKVPVRTALVGR
jgi:hypothetical protein